MSLNKARCANNLVLVASVSKSPRVVFLVAGFAVGHVLLLSFDTATLHGLYRIVKDFCYFTSNPDGPSMFIGL